MWAWTVHMCFNVRITHWRMKETNGLHLYSHSFVILIALLTSDTGLWHFKRLSLIMWSSPASPGWLMFLNTSHIPAQGIYFSSIFILRRWSAQAVLRERWINQYSLAGNIINLSASWPGYGLQMIYFRHRLLYLNWWPGQPAILELYFADMRFLKFRSYLYVRRCTVTRFKEILNTVWDVCVVFIEDTNQAKTTCPIKSLWKFSICLFSEYKGQVYLKELFY